MVTMSKRYTSTITVTWEGNMLDAENMEEYIKQLKQDQNNLKEPNNIHHFEQHSL